jgi:tRNA pseudouridine55 synthase
MAVLTYEYNGVLNIDKPAGWTSHDVVAWVRKTLKIKKIGHAGTLDPDATGVLVVCIGKATKLVEYLVGIDKEYEAVMRLGEATDTQDASGKVLEKKAFDSVGEEAVLNCFREMTGEISQVPPAYSAIKIGGVPSYKLARRGEEVSMPGRRVTIYGMTYIKKEGPDVFFKVHCSKGTYVRTLCHDMGIRLGTAAHLYSLRRTRSGTFDIKDSVTLEKLSDDFNAGKIEQDLYGMEEAMTGFPSIDVDPEGEKNVVHGRPVFLSAGQGESLPAGEPVCLKNKNGSLIALGVLEGKNSNKIKVEKVLVQ